LYAVLGIKYAYKILCPHDFIRFSFYQNVSKYPMCDVLTHLNIKKLRVMPQFFLLFRYCHRCCFALP